MRTALLAAFVAAQAACGGYRIADAHDRLPWRETETDGSSTGTDGSSEDGDASADSESAGSTTTTGPTGDAGSGSGDTGDAGSSSTSSADTTAADTTTAAPVVCGDGVVEGDEECDDANASDADDCFTDCTRRWTVFVTSEPDIRADFNGITGADYQCRHRATNMFLPNGERYRAWVSTSEVQAVDRLYHARGPYVLVNGLQVAANWDALVAGPLDHAIDVSEKSETVVGPVWTGTTPAGLRAPGSDHCADWTVTDPDNSGVFGASNEVGGWWTMFDEPVSCGVYALIYCFEQP